MTDRQKRIGSNTLGIEITDADLVDACDLGNIDPQHGFARGPKIAGRAAIDVALRWPLPPRGAMLATIRPDADSIGAMAVLSLRAEGVAFTPEMRARVDLVVRSDCFDFGGWEGWAATHPPPLPHESLLALSPHPPEFRELAASISAEGCLSEDVAKVRDWLLTGTLSPNGRMLVRAADEDTAMAWSAGLLQIKILLDKKIVHVISDYRGAVALGYRYAPVVIAEGKVDGKRKITIAQFARGYVDFAYLARRLNAIESGWGGSETILGSPQGISTEVNIDIISVIIEEISTRI